MQRKLSPKTKMRFYIPSARGVCVCVYQSTETMNAKKETLQPFAYSFSLIIPSLFPWPAVQQ